MKILETSVVGAYQIELEPQHDERGFFARSFCAETFRNHGLATEFVQSSVSFNTRRGTLRGLHWQAAPHGEIKIVRCTRGRAFDVIVDARRDSSSFGVHYHTELSAENHRALYVPEGVAHGFQTLEDDVELLYQMAGVYVPEASRGIAYDDAALAIPWPGDPTVISSADRSWPTLAEVSGSEGS